MQGTLFTTKVGVKRVPDGFDKLRLSLTQNQISDLIQYLGYALTQDSPSGIYGIHLYGWFKPEIEPVSTIMEVENV